MLYLAIVLPYKVANLSSELDALVVEVNKNRDAKTRLQEDLNQISESNQLQLSDLLDKLDGKTKAGTCSSLCESLLCRDICNPLTI